MADSEGKGGKTSGWSDKDLLVTLLSVIHKSDVSLNYKNGVFPVGRNANGFKQKIRILINASKHEWDAVEAGQSASDGAENTKKVPKSRKRKAKTDEDADDNVPVKKRGRPKKNAEPEEREKTPIKEEVKDENDESGLDD